MTPELPIAPCADCRVGRLILKVNGPSMDSRFLLAPDAILLQSFLDRNQPIGVEKSAISKRRFALLEADLGELLKVARYVVRGQKVLDCSGLIGLRNRQPERVGLNPFALGETAVIGRPKHHECLSSRTQHAMSFFDCP